MILLAGGDSFTYGSELADGVSPLDPNGTEPAYPIVSQSTFPALLARDFGMQYECAAYPGFSNSAIRRTVMNACERIQNIGLVIVTWTFPGRYEFRFEYDTGERWGNWYNLNPWSIIDNVEDIKKEFRANNTTVLQHHTNHLLRAKQTGTADFAKTFYKHVGSTAYWETYNSLTEIIMLQQYLQLKKTPYIFSMVDEALLNNCTYLMNDENITTLYNQIDFDRWVTFPNNQGFYTWARDFKYPFATTHPLEPAHVDAAKYIKENYNELVNEFIPQN
jgi:hypothetical protein